MSRESRVEMPLIMIGAGGHAKVLLSLLRLLDWPILGVCCPELARQGVLEWRGMPVLGRDDVISQYSNMDIGLVNGVGKKVGDISRQVVFERFKAQGYYFPLLIHPAAVVDVTAQLEEGVQVMAGAVIQADAQVAVNTIINSRACVDHDCQIGAHSHIAPGAVLCGNVKVEPDSYIGAGAVLTQGLRIGVASIIGAGASIVRDVSAKSRILPAQVRQTEG